MRHLMLANVEVGLTPCPFTDILDVMRETGFPGLRITGFDGFLQHYDLTVGQLHRELSRRDLEVATISWNGPLHDPSQRVKVLDSARKTMKFLAGFGANHLVVFPPARDSASADPPEVLREIGARSNQIGELAGKMGFTAGLHNHLGAMVQTQEEVDQFMSMTAPKRFGLSPDTAHLHLVGGDVVGTFERYKHRICFLDYKDAKWTNLTQDWIEPNGEVVPKASPSAKFLASIYDLGDGKVPTCGLRAGAASE